MATKGVAASLSKTDCPSTAHHRNKEQRYPRDCDRHLQHRGAGNEQLRETQLDESDPAQADRPVPSCGAGQNRRARPAILSRCGMRRRIRLQLAGRALSRPRGERVRLQSVVSSAGAGSKSQGRLPGGEHLRNTLGRLFVRRSWMLRSPGTSPRAYTGADRTRTSLSRVPGTQRSTRALVLPVQCRTRQESRHRTARQRS